MSESASKAPENMAVPPVMTLQQLKEQVEQKGISESSNPSEKRDLSDYINKLSLPDRVTLADKIGIQMSELANMVLIGRVDSLRNALDELTMSMPAKVIKSQKKGAKTAFENIKADAKVTLSKQATTQQKVVRAAMYGTGLALAGTLLYGLWKKTRRQKSDKLMAKTGKGLLRLTGLPLLGYGLFRLWGWSSGQSLEQYAAAEKKKTDAVETRKAA